MFALLQPLLQVPSLAITRRFHHQTQNPGPVQAQFLHKLLTLQAETELGRNYRLGEIRSLHQFRQRVPILPYSSYLPYLDKITQGQPNVLTPDPVLYLNMTSGSTGRQKLIPVTRRTRYFRGRANLTSLGFALQASQRWHRTFGQMLLTSSVNFLGKTPTGIPYGPVSVGDLRSSNPLSLKLLAHPFLAMEPKDSLTRHYLCLLFALANPQTRMIGANFPVLALQLCRYLEQHLESLLTDLEKGDLAPFLDLDPQLRQSLQARLAPAPRRAAHFRRQLETTGRPTPQTLWPDLAFLVTARGGTSNFYFQRFPGYFGETPIFGGLYASAESVFGIYHDLNDDGSILAINSGFYEFVPVADNSDQPETLLAEEVEVGQHYRILVTNYHGFYRYDIGDVVEVLGFYGKTPLITFRHRRGGLLSSTTEKTTEFHVIQVMERLQRMFGVTLENFCVTLGEEVMPPPYLVNVELAAGSSLPYPEAFLEQFDQQLQAIHASYQVKRSDVVPPPRLRILAAGSFAQLRQRLLQRGIPEHHLKFPHISEDRQLLAHLPVQAEIGFPPGKSSPLPIDV